MTRASYTLKWDPPSQTDESIRSGLGGTFTTVGDLLSNKRYLFAVVASNGVRSYKKMIASSKYCTIKQILTYS